MGEVQSFHIDVVPESKPAPIELETSEQKQLARDIWKMLKGFDFAAFDARGRKFPPTEGFKPAEVAKSLFVLSEIALGETSEDSKFYLDKKGMTASAFLIGMQKFARLMSERVASEDEIPPKSQQH